jgi:hypothetical protein
VSNDCGRLSLAHLLRRHQVARSHPAVSEPLPGLDEEEVRTLGLPNDELDDADHAQAVLHRVQLDEL